MGPVFFGVCRGLAVAYRPQSHVCSRAQLLRLCSGRTRDGITEYPRLSTGMCGRAWSAAPVIIRADGPEVRWLWIRGFALVCPVTDPTGFRQCPGCIQYMLTPKLTAYVQEPPRRA